MSYNRYMSIARLEVYDTTSLCFLGRLDIYSDGIYKLRLKETDTEWISRIYYDPNHPFIDEFQYKVEIRHWPKKRFLIRETAQRNE